LARRTERIAAAAISPSLFRGVLPDDWRNRSALEFQENEFLHAARKHAQVERCRGFLLTIGRKARTSLDFLVENAGAPIDLDARAWVQGSGVRSAQASSMKGQLRRSFSQP